MDRYLSMKLIVAQDEDIIGCGHQYAEGIKRHEEEAYLFLT